MTRQSEETRSAPLSIRTRSSIKKLVDAFAREDDRSATQVLERLILAEADRRDSLKKKPR